jgi:hypothetical protein
VLACVAIGREVTVAPSGDSELSQVYLYGEAITGLDAFFDSIADEEASGAELADVTLTTPDRRQPTHELTVGRTRHGADLSPRSGEPIR